MDHRGFYFPFLFSFLFLLLLVLSRFFVIATLPSRQTTTFAPFLFFSSLLLYCTISITHPYCPFTLFSLPLLFLSPTPSTSTKKLPVSKCVSSSQPSWLQPSWQPWQPPTSTIKDNKPPSASSPVTTTLPNPTNTTTTRSTTPTTASPPPRNNAAMR